MGLLSHGLWPEESKRMGRVVRQDFAFAFAVVTGFAVATRLLVFWLYGE